jgi:hypothetical protein
MHREGIFEVKASAGDTHLGVEDFDVLLTTSSSSAHIPCIVKLVSDLNSEECNKCTSGTKYVCFFYFHPFLLLTGGI